MGPPLAVGNTVNVRAPIHLDKVPPICRLGLLILLASRRNAVQRLAFARLSDFSRQRDHCTELLPHYYPRSMTSQREDYPLGVKWLTDAQGRLGALDRVVLRQRVSRQQTAYGNPFLSS